MRFTPITLSQQETVNRIRNRYGHHSASHAFHSVYIWQKAFGLSILLEDDFFVVKYGKLGDHAYFVPCGNPAKTAAFLRAVNAAGKYRLLYIQKEEVRQIMSLAPTPLRFRYRRDDSEYIYDIPAQCALAGKQFAATRKKIHRLKAQYQVTARPLDADTVEDARQIINAWSTQKLEGLGNAHEEIETDLCYLEHMDALSGAGTVMYLDGVPSAVAAGAPLDAQTFDLCICKQTNWTAGTNLCVRNLLVRQLAGRYTVLNSEEDLGLPGLRRHKTEMHPARMLNMWEAVNSE